MNAKPLLQTNLSEEEIAMNRGGPSGLSLLAHLAGCFRRVASARLAKAARAAGAQAVARLCGPDRPRFRCSRLSRSCSPATLPVSPAVASGREYRPAPRDSAAAQWECAHLRHALQSFLPARGTIAPKLLLPPPCRIAS